MSPLAGVRAVVFDLGGVLVDFGPAGGVPWGPTWEEGRRAVEQRLRESGVGPGALELEEFLFGPWRRGYRRRYQNLREEPWAPHLARLRAATGTTATDEDLLTAYFAPYGRTITALPGALETVDALARRGYRLGVVSNVPLPGWLYRRELCRLGFLPALASLRFSSDAPARKPDPGMLREVLGELSVGPAAAVMVGDRRDADVGAARSAGTAAVWIQSGHEDGPREDLAIAAVGELLAYLPGPA
jgi:FMN phosphatase YigB (HAD superfamily)